MLEISSTLLLATVPLILIEIILKVICLRDWIPRAEFNGLSKLGWLLIFLFLTLLGPVAYLVYGRRND